MAITPDADTMPVIKNGIRFGSGAGMVVPRVRDDSKRSRRALGTGEQIRTNDSVKPLATLTQTISDRLADICSYHRFGSGWPVAEVVARAPE